MPVFIFFDSWCRSCAGATKRSQETKAVIQSIERDKESDIFIVIPLERRALRERERELNCKNLKKRLNNLAKYLFKNGSSKNWLDLSLSLTNI